MENASAGMQYIILCSQVALCHVFSLPVFVVVHVRSIQQVYRSDFTRQVYTMEAWWNLRIALSTDRG